LDDEALTGESVIVPFPEDVTPASVPMTEEVQLKVVPAIEDVGRKFNGVPLHISWMRDVDEFVIAGRGETVITTSTGVPAQLPALGVIRYVTDPVVTPSVEVRTWPIVAPLPAVAPVTFVALNTVHV
jgi:hypothetical protein